MSDVNITITSQVGYKVAAGAIQGPVTYLQTLQDLSGNVYLPDVVPTRVLSVSQPDDFLVYPGFTPVPQTVTLTNSGNSNLAIDSVLLSSAGVTPQIVYGPGWSSSGTVVISPSSTASFSLSYIGNKNGEFVNSITVVSDNDSGRVKILTKQKVATIFDFEVLPTFTSTTLTTWGSKVEIPFSVVPFADVVQTATFSISGDPGFEITSQSTQTVILKFNTYDVSQISGVYTATLTVNANTGTIKTAQAEVTVDINQLEYQHIGDWTSPASYNNSIISMSYDIIEGKKTLTIGVGSGYENVPDYTQGGQFFVTTSTLSFEKQEAVVPYPYWALVYRITLDGSQRSYRVNKKYHAVTPYFDYGQYFGDFNSQGAMFVVEDDGYGNLTIGMNRLRTLTDDEGLNLTLSNLTRAFYDCSLVDVPSRFGSQAAPILDGTMTEIFTGFNRLGHVTKNIVPLPK